ncbi:hypothetical protein IEQ34_014878 [Dendrobium chrysotoxum]|uniref:WRKY domain-containing protein n=1 Tax=Dendrobium chrysotoxum TaxID=161865 RepID=A0AAV7GKG8_DENCH|nr:hypothetical protein IEQ34_014878 [Dendrobium chrysotoxum]
MTVEVSSEQTQMVESPVKGEEPVKLEETTGIRRRKSQAKKVVCIPAPTAAIGSLARKQVERSRTDPNMLVITYTSKNNHPWPTQRNAFAGSTRFQP